MLFNQLHLLPTDETREYISSVMSTCPFDINLDLLSILVLTSRFEIPEIPQLVYTAKSLNAEIIYNSEVQASGLVVSFDSPQMQELYKYLTVKEGLKDAFYDAFFPHMNLVQYMPANSQPTRRFVLSIKNIFGDSEREFTFSHAVTQSVDLSFPPDADYQQKMEQGMSYGVSSPNYSGV